MKCMNCGKELKVLREFTEQELKELDYINCKVSNASQALSPDILNKLELTDEKFYAYIRANTDAMADGIYCDNMFKRDIAKEFNIPPFKLIFMQGQICVHEEE